MSSGLPLKADIARYSRSSNVPASELLKIGRCEELHTVAKLPVSEIQWAQRRVCLSRRSTVTMARCAPLAAPPLDRRLGLRIENVKPGGAHRDAQLVAHLHPHGRLDARHHDALANLHIEQNFRAELLDHFNHPIEARVVEIGGTRHREVLRAHAERDLVADMAAQALRGLLRQLDAQAGVLGDQRSVRLAHGHGGEIHRGRADETGDELVGGLIVQFERLAYLLDHAVLHDDDPVSQRHGLDLIVGHVNGGGTETQVQLLELDAYLHPQLGIEVRQWLVEQEHAGVTHDGAAQRYALALAAGELARLALEQFADAEDVGRLPHPLLDLAPF